jgi:hypothetical protein
MSVKHCVPEGMVQAGATGWLAARGPDGKLNPMEVARSVLNEAIPWLTRNPIVPTLEQAQYMYDGAKGAHDTAIQYCMTQWQRRMFYAPEGVEKLDFYIKTASGDYVPWQPSPAQEAIVDKWSKGEEPVILDAATLIVIDKLRQIRFDLARKLETTSIALVVEGLDDILRDLGDT